MIPYNKRQDAQIVKIKDYINGKGKYVTGEGTSITLENTVNTPFNNIILKGNTSQNGEPTPSSPVDVNVVSGSNVVSTSNKNLFNAQIQAGTYNKATYSVASDGLITQNASDNSSWSTTQTRNFYLDAGTYTINCIGKGTEKKLQVRNVTDNVDIIETQSEKETFTLTERKLLAIKTWGSSTYPASYYVQIEKGSEATTYEPHQGKELPLDLGSIELCKIGNYQDYFYKENNKWWKHKEIGKITNWDTDWYINTSWNKSYPNIMHIQAYDYSKNKITKYDGKTDIITLITTHMSSVLIKNRDYNKEQCFSHYGNGCITFFINKSRLNLKDNSSESDILNAFANYMNNNKVVAYFAANTSTDEQITDTTLITQLNALEQAVSYDDTTNISQTNANLPFIINAEAFKKLL